MADTLMVWGQNGERLRPEQGYPLRVLIPGWEGNVSVKWLRRIKVSDQPWHLRSETARYTDPMPEGKWRQFSFVMECKSVITRPSGGMTLAGPGIYAIEGFAWSGNGTIKAVDVTFDGGKTWREAALEEPILDRCLTRFRYRVGLGRRAGQDREPRRRQHRLRAADGRRDRQGARARRLRAASQRRFPVVGQPGRGGQKCGRVISCRRRARRCCCCQR